MNLGTVSTLLLLALLVATPLPATAAQDDYPSRPIRIIVPIPAGATADSLPRIIGERLAAKWGHPVVVENRPGAALNIGAEAVARAEPDGYTLLATPPSPLTVNQSLYSRLGYDPGAFTPVTIMAALPNVLMVHPRVGVSSLPGLIAYAKANPDKLTYASSGVGGTPHLSMELLKSVAGIQIVHVPYKGLAPALTDLIAGHVDMMFDNLGNALAPVTSGKLKGLGVGARERIAALPDVPAIAEAFPDFLSTTWFAIVAPPKTPPEIAAKLSSAIGEIIRQPDVAKRFADLSSTPVGSTPAETAAFIAEERERWHKVIAAAGIKPE
jgi:tripartite-type tricarboxylate transporter receptor subunit TctC